MNKNKTYFTKKEDEDYRKLEHFNNHFLKGEVERNNPCDWLDAHCTLPDNRDCNIELKGREFRLEQNKFGEWQFINESGYTCTTIFCEANKVSELLFQLLYNGGQPLYINFTINDYILVFNLAKLSHIPDMRVEFVKNKGYGYTAEKCYRYHLPITDATIYKRDGNNYELIKKGDGCNRKDC